MRLRFRQDIQGLRALAVVLVALDHAHVGPFHGGFVGVDIFFVISGFLITTLLVTEAEEGGSVSLMGFYARRARRILPAATLVVLVTIVASLVFLSAIEAKSAIGDAVWSTFFAANFKFAADGTDYFNAQAAASPFQHYWSLAVEEQFYLVWPLLVLGLCVLARWWARRHPTDRPAPSVRSIAVPVLVAVIAASFVFSVVSTRADPVVAYFSPFTRAWELGVGALAACLAPRVAKASPVVLAAASWVGLLAVGVAAVTYDGATPFPGYAAALPVGGVTLLLIGGLNPAGWGPQRGLAARPVRTVGDWSYSLYLWHWPALVIARAIWGQPSGWYGAAVLLVALGLAGLTYHLVENPFRRSRVITIRHLRGVLLYPAVVVVTMPLLAAAGQVVDHEVASGGPAITTATFGQTADDPAPSFSDDPVVALVQASVLAAENQVEIPAGLEPSLLDLEAAVPDLGDCDYFQFSERLCPRGDTQGERTLVLIGDSHARQWIPAVDRLSRRLGYTAYYLVREGCPAADITPWRDDGAGPNQDCARFRSWALRQIADLHPDVVLLASRANPSGFVGTDGERVQDRVDVAPLFRDAATREIDTIASYAGRVVVIGDPPAITLDPGPCLSRRNATLESCLSPTDPRSVLMIDALRQAAAATGTQYVETGQWFCAGGLCPSVIGDFVVRRDYAHVSPPYVDYLTDELEQQIRLDRG